MEDYAYPNADRIQRDQGIKLIKGDGHITLATCDDSAQQIKVLTEVGAERRSAGRVLLQGECRERLPLLELPRVFELETVDHPISADLRPQDDPTAPVKTVNVDKKSIKSVGEDRPVVHRPCCWNCGSPADRSACLPASRSRTTGEEYLHVRLSSARRVDRRPDRRHFTSAAVAALTAAPATAVSGPTASAAVSAATARLNVGGQRGCSATLVAGPSFADRRELLHRHPGGTLASGAPKLKTTATIGGSVQQVVNLVPRTDRDVVMAQLAKPGQRRGPYRWPAPRLPPGTRSRPPGSGVPARSGSPTRSTRPLSPCRTPPPRPSTWRASRTAQRSARATPAVRYWAPPEQSWVSAACLAGRLPGYRSGRDPHRRGGRPGRRPVLLGPAGRLRPRLRGSPVEARRRSRPATTRRLRRRYACHMDLIVVWGDGEVTLYQGGYGNDPARPFAAEHQLKPGKSVFTQAVNVTGIDAGGGTDGVVVRWSDGEMTLYTSVDAKGFHGEKQLAAPSSAEWKDDARQLTGGRFAANGLRDDLLVSFKDGHVSVFVLAVNGLKKQTQPVAKNNTWPAAEVLASGSFTGKATDDLLVRWIDGETTIYPGMTGTSLPRRRQDPLPQFAVEGRCRHRRRRLHRRPHRQRHPRPLERRPRQLLHRRRRQGPPRRNPARTRKLTHPDTTLWGADTGQPASRPLALACPNVPRRDPR